MKWVLKIIKYTLMFKIYTPNTALKEFINSVFNQRTVEDKWRTMQKAKNTHFVT